MMKYKIIFLLAVLIFLLSSPVAFAWGPITHYQINKEADPGFRDAWLYRSGGTGPDMFITIPGTTTRYVNRAHAPLPYNQKKPDGSIIYWRDKPNFAYIMLRTTGPDDNWSDNYIAAKGWGGHIAADWGAVTVSGHAVDNPAYIGSASKNIRVQ